MSNRKQKILYELQLKAYAEGMSPSAAAAEWIIKLQDALRVLHGEVDGGIGGYVQPTRGYISTEDDPDYGLGEDDET